jgi:hypothetical protein
MVRMINHLVEAAEQYDRRAIVIRQAGPVSVCHNGMATGVTDVLQARLGA